MSLVFSAVNVCVGFEETSYVVVEEIGYFLACINIECPQHLLREVTVTLTTASSTASKNCAHRMI